MQQAWCSKRSFSESLGLLVRGTYIEYVSGKEG